jgi:protease-4
MSEEQNLSLGTSPERTGMIERVLLAGIEEQRRARRWRIFFRLSGLAIVLLVLLISGLWGGMGGASSGGGRHTALVEIKGVIGSEGDASADAITESLRAAFDDPNTAGVLIRINSPGGSPVQSGIVYHEIRRLRAKHPSTPVHVVVEEICASGGYYVAAAADKIFVDRASLIGSIGVLMDSFGFVEALRKLGIERRVMTAGENKAFLDAFSPMDERQRAHAQTLLDEIHAQFIEAVRTGRGDRIVNSPEIFSGLIWSGARSVELGLADGLGSVNQVARDVIGAERVVDFSRKEDFADKLARRLGTEGARSLSEVLSAAISSVRLR